ncbi:MAG TPA: plastocyanin/azurin family copper-binding protein [Gemmatimonadaceae bacterium]|jgi:plastocyanin
MNIIKIVSLASLVVIASCGSSATGPNYGGNGSPPPSCVPGSGTVCLVSGNQFSPTQITVTAGSSITFNNVSGTTHNVTFTTTGSPANVPDFASGTKVVAFPTAGTYDYHCTIHGLSMSGVVVVQ